MATMNNNKVNIEVSVIGCNAGLFRENYKSAICDEERDYFGTVFFLMQVTSDELEEIKNLSEEAITIEEVINQ